MPQLLSLVVKLIWLGCIADRFEAAEILHQKFTPNNELKFDSLLDSKTKLLSARNVHKNPEVPTKNDDLFSLLNSLVELDSEHCQLILVVNNLTMHSEPVALLLQLQQTKMVVSIGPGQFSLSSAWKEPYVCTFVFYFIPLTPALVELANGADHFWNFYAWIIFHGGTRIVEKLQTALKAAKTVFLTNRHVVVDWPMNDFQAFSALDSAIHTAKMFAVIKLGRNKVNWALYEAILFAPKTDRIRRVSIPEIHYQLHSSSTVKDRRKRELAGGKLINLHGMKFKVVVFEWRPSIMYKRAENGTVVSAYGIDIQALHALADVLNFTFQLIEPPKGEMWGNVQNGTWSGLTGVLQRREAEFGLCNIYLTEDKVPYVDLSYPYDEEVSCFLVRTATPLPRWQSLVFPFTKWTWLAVLLCTVVSAIVLSLLITVAKCNGSKQNSVLILLELLFRQSADWDPNRDSVRVFMVFLGFYCFIVTTAYCSNLTAILTVVKNPPAMETIKALYYSGLDVLSLGMWYKGALASSVDPYLKGLAERFRDAQNLDNIFKEIDEGKSVSLHNKQFIEYTLATQTPSSEGYGKLKYMKECFSPYSITMVLQHKSPLKPYVNTIVGRLSQAGLIRYWFLDSLATQRRESNKESINSTSNSGLKSSEPDGSGVPLSLDHLSGCFLFLAFLNTSALILFIGELCLYHSRQRHYAE